MIEEHWESKHESHTFELSANEMIDSRKNYIHKNPVKEGIVENEFDYLYSSARNFAELPSVIKIEEL